MQGQAEGEGSYAFFPPGANSLGGVHYLGKIMVLLGSASAAMVEMGSAVGATKLEEKMRSTISAARERTVTALFTAWIRDAQNCKAMEDWTRAGENRGVTKMPGCFLAFEKEVVSGLQGIVYLDKVRTNESGIIVCARNLTYMRTL
jgi:exocyst complex component 2